MSGSKNAARNVLKGCDPVSGDTPRRAHCKMKRLGRVGWDAHRDATQSGLKPGPSIGHNATRWCINTATLTSNTHPTLVSSPPFCNTATKSSISTSSHNTLATASTPTPISTPTSTPTPTRPNPTVCISRTHWRYSLNGEWCKRGCCALMGRDRALFDRRAVTVGGGMHWTPGTGVSRGRPLSSRLAPLAAGVETMRAGRGRMHGKREGVWQWCLSGLPHSHPPGRSTQRSRRLCCAA